MPALVQTTKAGQIFVLNRTNGRPVFPVEERSVPSGVAPGERRSSTQPFSPGMPQIGVERLTESDMWEQPHSISFFAALPSGGCATRESTRRRAPTCR